MPLPAVQQPAPEFTVGALLPNKEFGDIRLSDYRGKWVVFFWYPLDFTFVCPTEIIAFGDRQDEFTKINTQVIAASCDSKFTHLAWVNTPRSEGGLGDMKIPIVADFSKTVANQYGVLIENGDDKGVPLRALFIIDPRGVLRQITCNDLPVGRNVDEIIRLIKAFQFNEIHGEVCPANWQPGDLTMDADPVKSKKYFAAANSGAASAGSASSAAGTITNVSTAAEFAAATASGTVVVDFWAPWCKNCKKLSPIFGRLATELAGKVKFVAVNTNEAEELANKEAVDSLPAVFFYKNGAKVGSFVGSDAAKLEVAIRAL